MKALFNAVYIWFSSIYPVIYLIHLKVARFRVSFILIKALWLFSFQHAYNLYFIGILEMSLFLLLGFAVVYSFGC